MSAEIKATLIMAAAVLVVAAFIALCAYSLIAGLLVLVVPTVGLWTAIIWAELRDFFR